MVIVNFIRDKEVGIYARAKRLSKVRSGTAMRDAKVNVEVPESSDSEKSE